jgi:hypothetical protein
MGERVMGVTRGGRQPRAGDSYGRTNQRAHAEGVMTGLEREDAPGASWV